MTALIECPQDIWRLVIQKWLMIKDLCKFDSAICSTEWRRNCLPYLHSDKGPWLMAGFLEAPLTFKSVNWLDFRNLLVKTIRIDGSFPLNWKNHQSSAVHTVICEHFMEEESALALTECLMISPLHRLVIRKFRLIDGTHLNMLLQACLQQTKPLVSLELSSCSAVNDDMLNLIAQKCKSLLSICFRDCRSITSAALIEVLNANPNLVSIDIAGCSQIDDSVLKPVANDLPMIVDVNICGCIRVSTPAVLSLISSRKLERLNVKGCYKVDQTQAREAMEHIVAMEERDATASGLDAPPACTMTIEADTSPLVVLYHRVTGDKALCGSLTVIFSMFNLYLAVYHADYMLPRLAKRYKAFPIVLDTALLFYYRHNLWWAWKNPRLAWPAFCRTIKQHYSGASNRTPLQTLIFGSIGTMLPAILLAPLMDMLQFLSKLVFGASVEVEA